MGIFLDYINELPAENTRRGYKASVVSFLQFVTADRHARDDLGHWDKVAGEYLKQTADPFADLQRFLTSRAAAAPRTKRSLKTGIVGWLESTGLELPRRMERQLKTKCKGGSRVLDRIPTKDELKAILNHAKQPYHALLLVLFTGGMRVSEACALTWDDVNFDTNPTQIKVTSTKTGTRYVAYISREARESLLQWQKYYPTYLLDRDQRIHPDLRDNYPANNRIFPFSTSQVRRAFYILIKKSGCAVKDHGRFEVHIHSARKWFTTTIGKAGNELMQQKLINHEGYLSRNYDRTPQEDVAAFYRENENLLWLFTPVNVNTPEVREKMEEYEKRIKELEEQNRKQQAVISIIESLLKTNPEVLKELAKS